MEHVKEILFDLQDMTGHTIFRNNNTLFKRSEPGNTSFICSGPSHFVRGTIILTRPHQESPTDFSDPATRRVREEMLLGICPYKLLVCFFCSYLMSHKFFQSVSEVETFCSNAKNCRVCNDYVTPKIWRVRKTTTPGRNANKDEQF
jgi:hypothetical protein